EWATRRLSLPEHLGQAPRGGNGRGHPQPSRVRPLSCPASQDGRLPVPQFPLDLVVRRDLALLLGLAVVVLEGAQLSAQLPDRLPFGRQVGRPARVVGEGHLAAKRSRRPLRGTGRTLTLAGLALTSIISPGLNGLGRFVALVAGFLTSLNLTRSGMANTPGPFWPSCRPISPPRAVNTAATSLGWS